MDKSVLLNAVIDEAYSSSERESLIQAINTSFSIISRADLSALVIPTVNNWNLYVRQQTGQQGFIRLHKSLTDSEQYTSIPTHIIEHVLHSKQVLHYSATAQTTPSTAQELLKNRQIASLLCLPIMDNSQQILGVIYLEKSLVAEKAELKNCPSLMALCEQAALSLILSNNQTSTHRNKKSQTQSTRINAHAPRSKYVSSSRFNYELSREWQRAKRERMPVSLLYLHASSLSSSTCTKEAPIIEHGNKNHHEEQQNIISALLTILKRPFDIFSLESKARVAILLPNTDYLGARHVAQLLLDDLKNRNHHATESIDYKIGGSSMMPTTGLASSTESLIQKAQQNYHHLQSQTKKVLYINGDIPQASVYSTMKKL